MFLLTLAFVSPSSIEAASLGWADARVVGPFACRADFPLNEAEDLLAELVELQNDLVRLLGVPPAAERVEIYLFHDQDTYRRYLAKHFPKVPYRRALYVKGRGPGRLFAYRSPQFDVDVRHESTHALLHAALPEVPLWLDEGLAKYFELPPDKRVYESPYLVSLRWMARLGATPALEALEKRDDLADMDRIDYRDAWAWVHFMLHGPPAARQELTAYLTRLRNDPSPEPLSTRLRKRLPGLPERVAEHFRGWERPMAVPQGLDSRL